MVYRIMFYTLFMLRVAVNQLCIGYSMCCVGFGIYTREHIHALLDFSLTIKAAPHECVIRTCQPKA